MTSCVTGRRSNQAELPLRMNGMPGSDLLSRRRTLHYHGRGRVSLLCSEWEQVVPRRCCRQAKGVQPGFKLLSQVFLGNGSGRGRSRQPPDVLRGCAARTFGSLVPASSTPRGASTSGLSTSWSPTFLIGLKPGTTHLGACFPLRCFQRLSVPDLAAGRCHWRDSPKTSGPFTPVLSY